MPDLLCPFSAPIVKQDFACQHAQEIIRRGGSEIACQQSDAHGICMGLHAAIKASALQAMGLEDDLLSLPHNVLVKIQYGGLLGLQHLISGTQDDTVGDIASLVSEVKSRFNAPENIPLDTVNKTIIDFKTQRRRKK